MHAAKRLLSVFILSCASLRFSKAASSFNCWSNSGDQHDLGKQGSCLATYNQDFRWCLLRYYTDSDKTGRYDRGCGVVPQELKGDIQQSMRILFARAARMGKKFICYPNRSIPSQGIVDCLCQSALCNDVKDDSMISMPTVPVGFGNDVTNARIFVPATSPERLPFGGGYLAGSDVYSIGERSGLPAGASPAAGQANTIVGSAGSVAPTGSSDPGTYGSVATTMGVATQKPDSSNSVVLGIAGGVGALLILGGIAGCLIYRRHANPTGNRSQGAASSGSTGSEGS